MGSSERYSEQRRPRTARTSGSGAAPRSINQYLAAGLLDELELHLVPVLLGDGARLFENLGDAEVQLEQVRAVQAPGVTHLKYRTVK